VFETRIVPIVMGIVVVVVIVAIAVVRRVVVVIVGMVVVAIANVITNVITNAITNAITIIRRVKKVRPQTIQVLKVSLLAPRLVRSARMEDVRHHKTRIQNRIKSWIQAWI